MTAPAPIRVAVSGLHAGENAQPGPGVIRSLREALGDRVSIVGIAYDALDSSLYAPGLLDDGVLFPYPSAGPEAWFDRLLQIRNEGGVDLLIPNLDVELPLVQRLVPRLQELGVSVVLPDTAAFQRRTKDRLPELAAQFGIAVPETVRVLDSATLAQAGARLGYPLVVKGPFYEAEVVHGPAEATTAFLKLSAKWGLPLLAQRFVKGEEFDVVCLGDGKGRMLGAVPMRKTMITKMGKAWGGVTIDDPALVEVARKLVCGLQWRGGCEVEALRGATDGRIYLIEVNPRFPAWVYLATAAGCNLPLGLLRLARGEPVPDLTQYRVGISYVRHAVEAIGDLADMESLMALGRARRRDATA